MKNMHVLPTDKPSNIVIATIDGKLKLNNNINDSVEYNGKNQNLYITSDEEIKIGDWILDAKFNLVDWAKYDHKDLSRDWSKIILTTDQDLIKDGVQAIDDEFLEWFVKNPSCEWVEINKTAPIRPFGSLYIIIIPKTTQQIIDEDFAGGLEMGQIIPKEETLEEVAERVIKLK